VQRPIFVAATRQHVGKTTCSLALMSGLAKKFKKVVSLILQFSV
jgi:cobyrinic acid a,c-diamide synthase